VKVLHNNNFKTKGIMIKITFEVSEEMIKEGLDAESSLRKSSSEGSNDILRSILDVVSYSLLNKYIEQGQTEFVVKKEELDDKSKVVYDQHISSICVLAAFSEIDKAKK
jgi:hypothetical protein